MKTKYWILIFTAIVLLCGIFCVFLFRAAPAPSASIYLDGKLYRTVSLSQDQVIEIDTEYGHNTVTVADGKLSVTNADCPDGYCMTKPKSGGAPIICLPHRLVIKFTSSVPDGISG